MTIKKTKLLTTFLLLLVALVAKADNWDYIRESGEYYYGTGIAATKEEANNAALASLSSMIATYISSRFTQLDDITTSNDKMAHESKVQNCIKTYTYSSLRNVSEIEERIGNNIVVHRYIKRSELDKIYEARKQSACELAELGDESLQHSYVDQALKLYYWSYSLVRSLQKPEEALGNDGKQLIRTLPIKIENVLREISIEYDGRDEDRVNMLFNYKGHPVSSLTYSFNNGREIETDNQAKDGRGCLVMIPGYETDTYHIDIEYQFVSATKGDKELESVLGVMPTRYFKDAAKVVTVDRNTVKTKVISEQKQVNDQTGVKLTPKETQMSENASSAQTVMEKVMQAITSRSSSRIMTLCTPEGLSVYNSLIGYGDGRIVGTPNLKFLKGTNGTTVVRGLQMSFVVGHGSKKRTFVEDVVFTLNAAGKICNVAFGLGNVAANNILCRNAPGWKDETREMLMEFLENYKTAYCLKRFEYIKSIFADDAIIIIGNVAHPRTRPMPGQERAITIEGQQKITYNRYSKDEYLRNLKRCFDNNEFINIQFGQNDIQWLEKYDKEEIFAINIRQEYTSSSYSDKGYLFLMVDMTNHDEPQIKVRTWQPNEVPLEQLYNAGDFYND